MSELTYQERPAAGAAQGLLVLHHGRGTSELDLLPLADALDPERRLHVVAPRGPLRLPGSPGYHWYRVPRVGYPDSDTFEAARRALAALHDEVSAQAGIPLARTVLGGFSMGTVMSYALGLDPDRPAPAGILAFSGFIPTVEGWRPELESRTNTRVFIAHGRRDPVIDVSFAQGARQLLEDAGLEVDYRESEAAHNIDPADVVRAGNWLATVPA
ncbi:MAG: phospholipase/carboxylesterase [Solirubrobacteraceae bacterium]|jgi:phospholipase/carboxylesterase|nr:phospholipase/carboxylesterase [Solirubrobacteraceae bacterium]